MMDTAQYLMDHDYTHGYGTFWHVRVMQERTQGALTFTGVTPCETEAGAVSPNALGFMRWGEMSSMSDLDVCPEKTFLLLTREEQELVAPWIEHVGAPLMYENNTYLVYGFESSQAFAVAMAEGVARVGSTEYDSLQAAVLAANYTVKCIELTQDDPEHWYGVKFELALPEYIHLLGK